MNDCVKNDLSLFETLQAELVADGSNTIRLSPVIPEQG